MIWNCKEHPNFASCCTALVATLAQRTSRSCYFSFETSYHDVSSLDTVEDGHELLELVRRRNCIDYTQPGFLYSLLRDINREDLLRRVDEYATEANKLLPNRAACCCSRPDEEFESMKWFKQSYGYRLSLKQLADKLEARDLEAMKHFCTGLIPKVQLEKITHVLELFIALEDYDKLSQSDMSILEDILPEKKHFLRPLYTQFDSLQLNSRQTTVQHQTIDKLYKESYSER